MSPMQRYIYIWIDLFIYLFIIYLLSIYLVIHTPIHSCIHMSLHAYIMASGQSIKTTQRHGRSRDRKCFHVKCRPALRASQNCWDVCMQCSTSTLLMTILKRAGGSFQLEVKWSKPGPACCRNAVSALFSLRNRLIGVQLRKSSGFGY